MAKVATPNTKATKEKATPETSAKSKLNSATPAPKQTTAAETAAPKAAAKQVAKTPTVTFEVISVRAFELFAQRGYVHGFDREDWIEAENKLKTESLN